MARDLAPVPGAQEGEVPLHYRRIVAKFGTNVLTAGTDRLDLEVMSALVGQVARLHKGGAVSPCRVRANSWARHSDGTVSP